MTGPSVKPPRPVVPTAPLSTRTFREMLETPPAPMPEPIASFPLRVFPGELMVLVGAPGTGKSFKVLEACLEAARGGVPSLYCPLEGAPTAIHRRVVALARDEDPASLPFQVLTEQLVDPKSHWVQRLKATVKEGGVGMVVVDPWQELVEGDENVAGDVLKSLEPLRGLADAGVAVVLVAHDTKSGRADKYSVRGSSALTGKVDGLVVMVETSQGVATLSEVKRRDVEQAPDVGVRRVHENGKIRFERGEPQKRAINKASTPSSPLAGNAEAKLLEAAREGPETLNKLSERAGLKHAVAKQALEALMTNGALVVVRHEKRHTRDAVAIYGVPA